MFGRRPLKISVTASKKSMSNTATSTPEQGPSTSNVVPLSTDYLPEAYITGTKILDRDDVDNEEDAGGIVSHLKPILRSSSSPQLSPRISAGDVGAGRGRQLLFFIDWDDTILPTTWLRGCKYLTNSIAQMEQIVARQGGSVKLPSSVRRDLSMIEDYALDLLLKCCDLGSTAIVTNSSVNWIPFTARHYLPRLIPVLETIPCVSARPQLPDNLSAQAATCMASSWKTFKFQEMACAYKMDFDCIVSIGDGFAERTAVMELRDIFPMCTCKAVRFMTQPNIYMLRDEIRQTLANLEEIADAEPFASDLASGTKPPRRFDVHLLHDGRLRHQMVPLHHVVECTGASVYPFPSV
ncbi:conserved hypothetical protein [Perkinsus marinus ATCC 50983]|uniref:Apicomplexan-conserved protein n=1 Tax=Perkinsus marinus (strain ATCC 50983 / TXsc) TaxID=423536 RepID=C5L7S2_PERM5|nr:conserved hypothetical protein [Perkinsus marinus ATCC 50983]EER07534.1 conserved hypothetical protein [Perkinsus marinus ATCC 50983]|eukprot:XP_002775718.1 conserved hypothetical protein [Perkinsus marinus ATCC 50983]